MSKTSNEVNVQNSMIDGMNGDYTIFFDEDNPKDESDIDVLITTGEVFGSNSATCIVVSEDNQEETITQLNERYADSPDVWFFKRPIGENILFTVVSESEVDLSGIKFIMCGGNIVDLDSSRCDIPIMNDFQNENFMDKLTPENCLFITNGATSDSQDVLETLSGFYDDLGIEKPSGLNSEKGSITSTKTSDDIRAQVSKVQDEMSKNMTSSDPTDNHMHQTPHSSVATTSGGVKKAQVQNGGLPPSVASALNSPQAPVATGQGQVVGNMPNIAQAITSSIVSVQDVVDFIQQNLSPTEVNDVITALGGNAPDKEYGLHFCTSCGSDDTVSTTIHSIHDCEMAVCVADGSDSDLDLYSELTHEVTCNDCGKTSFI